MRCIVILLLLPLVLKAQPVVISPQTLDAGVVEEAGSLTSYTIIHNRSAEVQYMLRTSGNKNIEVVVSKKKLLPGDTVHLRMRYLPKDAGRFNEAIGVWVSGMNSPIMLAMKGEIKKLLQDELQACVSFAPKKQEKEPEMVFVETPVPLVPMPATTHSELLDAEKYLPVNLVLLLDVSGSMKEEDKLPVLKASMRQLFSVLRPFDKVSIVTYASEVRVVASGISGNQKNKLERLCDTLVASGLTAGSQGLRQAYILADSLYIPGGNNQIILATDGNFGVRAAEKKIIKARSGDTLRQLKLSVMAFGNEKNYHKRLKQLCELGMGSFIPISKAGQGDQVLLDEIKRQSLRR